MASNLEIIHRWYQEIWIDGRHDRIDRIYRPAPADQCIIPDGTADPEEVREMISALTDLVSDPIVRIIHTVENNTWITALVELRGSKARAGKPVKLRWLAMMRISDGYIVESYPCMNLLPFFEDLEQLPPHSFELLLSGNVLN